ncbi:TfoX/Sxy family protein [Vannielia litorea]|uniref:TfoX/Sxy family protein n=1 Tax=Vannielia litorea TaxID=1217970 RepID=UPI001BCDCB09|nr:TfoX/Sxy family protein [Vannielia litorea]
MRIGAGDTMGRALAQAMQQEGREMAWDETVAERLREGLLAVEGVEEKRMFGGLCFLVRGNMACVASGRGGAFFRVGKDREAEALALPGAARMVMAGREKPGFIHFDGGSLEEVEIFTPMMRLCLGFVEPLPPK